MDGILSYALGAAFVAALAMSFIQPFYIETFTQNPTGRSMAVIGLVMMLFGLLTDFPDAPAETQPVVRQAQATL